MTKTKYLQRILTVLTIILIFFSKAAVYADSNNNNSKISVYIDPFYGGKEKGPLLLKKFESKQYTMAIAEQLGEALQRQHAKVIFSRRGDAYLSLDERLIKARLHSSSIYIAILIMHDKDCTYLFYPDPDKKYKHGRKQTDVGDMLDKLKRDMLINESESLANLIDKNLKFYLPQRCTQTKPRNDFILDNVSIPTVEIVFSIKDVDSKSLYIFDKTFMREMIDTIARSISEYCLKEENKNRKWDGSN